MTKGTAFIDGDYTDIENAKISILDWGFLHGDATYDVVHVCQSRFFRLDLHIERFFINMQKLKLAVPFDQTDVESILTQCVIRSGLKDAYVEMVCTRGTPKEGSRDPRDCTNNFFAFAIPYISIADQEKQQTGFTLFVSKRRRIAENALDPTIKNYHWLDMVMGLFDAYQHQHDTVVLTDENDNLVEGPGFNIFIVIDRIIYTPKKGMLLGITRQTVIEIAKTLNMTCLIQNIHRTMIDQADEVFITSTAGGVMAISQINNKSLEHNPITQLIQSTYHKWNKLERYTTQIHY